MHQHHVKGTAQQTYGLSVCFLAMCLHSPPQWDDTKMPSTRDARVEAANIQGPHVRAPHGGETSDHHSMERTSGGTEDVRDGEAAPSAAMESSNQQFRRFARAVLAASALLPVHTKSVRRRRDSLPADTDFAGEEGGASLARGRRNGQGWKTREGLPSLEDIAANGTAASRSHCHVSVCIGTDGIGRPFELAVRI